MSAKPSVGKGKNAGARPKKSVKKPETPSIFETWITDFAWALGLACLVLLLITLRDPQGRSFIYAVF